MPEPNPMHTLAHTVFTGDNLHVLRGINDDSVDLIYLDPPFNSNKSYSAPIGGKAAGAAFKDTWTLDDVDLAWHGEIAEREPAVYAVIDASGHSHGNRMKSYLIMMAVRLIEMRRVLKPSGSVYLHCDDAAGHYLKLLMDGIFGKDCFRNEITWRRYGSHNDARKYGRVSDKILFYAPAKATWNTQRLPLDSAAVARNYRHEDDRGRFATSPLHARTLSGGGYEYTWRGISDVWKFPKERLDALDADGRIYWPPKGRVPRRKVYLDEMSGKPASDVITDISIASGKERTGYPTQKPLALLERLIGSSSNEGDLVLDPFCGCATALIAAHNLRRRWIGIDISPMAHKLVKMRLERDLGVFSSAVQHRTDVPRRTDLGELPSYRTHKHTLYGLQEGICAGCNIHFPFRNLTIDHVIPRARGGSDRIDNLQLLCGACNSTKGTDSQAHLTARLKARGVIR